MPLILSPIGSRLFWEKYSRDKYLPSNFRHRISGVREVSLSEQGRKRQHPVLTRHRELLRFGERSKTDSRHSTSSWQAEDTELWRERQNLILTKTRRTTEFLGKVKNGLLSFDKLPSTSLRAGMAGRGHRALKKDKQKNNRPCFMFQTRLSGKRPQPYTAVN